MFPRRPLFRTVAPYARPNTPNSRTTRGPPRHFIPGTNAIESINFQLRKLIKTRGHFTSEDAAIKLLYLGIRRLNARHIDGHGLTRDRGQRGTGTLGWKAALNALAVRFGDRLAL